ncbi:hypothetical protein AAFF_G00391070 [Aldrovandia affinis]|uniref:Uncharacterized protein n=1 Tax=Aldrovandia affinis TaxID=143900 RepID=A0AAD7R3W2_9TELE|nr:hypothetical protein AAFF_G00391070 [Aldrovandia affinis]
MKSAIKKESTRLRMSYSTEQRKVQQSSRQVSSCAQREYMEELAAQLCGAATNIASMKKQTGHVPVPIRPGEEKSRKATTGRRHCEHCKATGQGYMQIPWMCLECQVPLCSTGQKQFCSLA